jgi:hypothetical protein
VCGKPGSGVKLKDGSKLVWEGQKDEAMYAGQPYLLQFALYDPEGKPAAPEPYLGMGGHAAIIRNDGNVYIHMHPAGTINMQSQTVMVRRIADTTRLAFYPTDPKVFSDSVDAWLKTLQAMPDATRDSLLMAEMPFEHFSGNMMDMGEESHANMLQFPYVFPSAGQYRIWVQVKRNGQVMTGAFDKLIE